MIIATPSRLAFLLCLTFAAPLLAEEELTVQPRWRIGVTSIGWDAPYDARGVVLEAGRLVTRELPGISWEVSNPAINLTPPEKVSNRSIRTTLEKALSSDSALAGLDLVFVFAPLSRSTHYYGYALNRFHPGGDKTARAVWYAVINTRPERVVVSGINRGLKQRGLGPVPSRLANRFDSLARWIDRRTPLLRHALVTTCVHEFGHFLAPGDHDVTDGIQTPWLANGNPEKNPDQHAPHCIMFLPGSTQSLWAKAREAQPDGIRFCDRCKKRLGVQTH